MRSVASLPPFTGTPLPNPPFNDPTNNTPCGRRIISTANGVNVAAQSLCLFHLMMANGTQFVSAPYVDAP
jgi:hypothetical protein